MPASSDDYLAGATQNPGSWWTDWQQWVTDHAGGKEKIPARKPGDGALKAIEDAPGAFVKMRLDKKKVAAK